MLVNKLKGLLQFDGLKISQYAFLVIPAIIFVMIFGFSSMNVDQLFESPILTVQFLLVLSYPFCYLLIKSIRNAMGNHKDEQLIPLWILLICQVSSLNLVCITVLLYGMVQNYGADMIAFRNMKITKQNKGFIISMVPIVLLYGLILFVRYRLGMLSL